MAARAPTTTQEECAAARIQSDEANSGTTITVGSKNFTEQKVLGEIYAQAFEAAGYTVEKELNLGDEKTALKALEGGDIDAYPEYTGTALLSFFGVQADKLPKDPAEAFEQAKDGLRREEPDRVRAHAVHQLERGRGHAGDGRRRSAWRRSPTCEPVAGDLTMYGSPECRQRLDCLLGLQEVYGLKFKKFVPVDIALRHEVLTKGQADVSIVFTTDPQIEREGFVLLEDDKGMFPPYNSTLVMRNEIVEQGGAALEEVVAQVNEGLTDEVMQELNARVDLDKKTPEAVAGEYLSETGLVQ